MKKVFKYIWANAMTLMILGYSIYIQNWLAAVAFFVVLITEAQSKLWQKFAEDNMKEIEKWHKKFLEVKYPNLKN